MLPFGDVCWRESIKGKQQGAFLRRAADWKERLLWFYILGWDKDAHCVSGQSRRVSDGKAGWHPHKQLPPLRIFIWIWKGERGKGLFLWVVVFITCAQLSLHYPVLVWADDWAPKDRMHSHTSRTKPLHVEFVLKLHKEFSSEVDNCRYLFVGHFKTS